MGNEEKTLVIVRGVSGAGKSTVAMMFSENGAWPVLEADQYHYNDDGEYDWKPENVSDSHAWCKNRVADAMSRGIQRIIVSNTFTTEKELYPYLKLAKDIGYRVVSIIIENRHGSDSIHSVPDHIRDKQEKRLRNSLVLK